METLTKEPLTDEDPLLKNNLARSIIKFCQRYRYHSVTLVEAPETIQQLFSTEPDSKVHVHY